MLQIVVNQYFQKAVVAGAVNLLRVGGLTVASVLLSRATTAAAKDLIAEAQQNYRLVRHEMSI